MSTSIIERTNTRGYEELAYQGDLNEFRIDGISKSWTNIWTDGYDSTIILKNVNAKDITAYLDGENNLYIVQKGSIEKLLNNYGQNGENYRPEAGGISLPYYDSCVISIYLEDKKGIRTKLDIEGYTNKITEQTSELLSKSGYGTVSEVLTSGNNALIQSITGIYKNGLFDLDITGTAGNDKIKGGNGADIINGGAGNDKLYGEKGNDTLYGAEGNDRLYGKDGDDILYGGNGNDSLYGGNGDDTIYGGEGNDKIYAEAGNNKIVLNLSSGNDTVYSGKGEDTLYFEDISSDKITYMKSGSNLVIGYGEQDSNGNYFNTVTLNKYLKNPEKSSVKQIETGLDGAKYEILSEAVVNFYGNPDRANKITGTKIRDYIEGGEMKDTLKGNAGDDVIYGYGGNDKINGDNGNDSLYGGAGDDTIKGGNGDDYIEGGTGNDKIYGGAGRNKILFNTGDGNDFVYLDKKGITDINISDADISSITYDKIGKNFVIKYSETDSITISNYFKTKNVQNLLGNGITVGNQKLDLSEMEISGQLQSNGLYKYEGSAENGNLITTTKASSAYVNTGNGNNTVYLNSSFGSVVGGSGSDTVYINGNNTFVSTNDGNDTIYVNSKDNTVDAGEGNNRIIINKSSAVSAGTGNDIYEVKNLSFNTQISDAGGIDEIHIGEKRQNMNFIYSVSLDETGQIANKNEDLYIVNDKVLKNISKSLGTGTLVSDYFSSENTDNSVEYIYSKDGWYISKTDIDMVRQQVAGWLNNNDYSSTDEVLASGNKTEINALLNIYQNTDNFWTSETVDIVV